MLKIYTKYKKEVMTYLLYRMYQKIVNPKTGRNVSIYGKIGKQVIIKYIKHLEGGANRASPANQYHPWGSR